LTTTWRQQSTSQAARLAMTTTSLNTLHCWS